MSDNRTLSTMLELLPKQTDKTIHLGKEMARFKNELGLPPDMFMAKLHADKDTKILIAMSYCDEMIEHKRASGAQEKAIDRTRKHNRELMTHLIQTGEMGEY